MEIYVPKNIAQEIITISESFGVAAQIIGHVESFEGKKLTIQSEFGEFVY
jgi:phosphoribosylformylglycinamidine cyclo-ligase